MLFEYKTDRLLMKILTPDYGASVLEFYLRDRELFEHTEPERLPNFYTVEHQRNILKCEYDMALKLNTIRFYVFEQNVPDKIIGTVCFHDLQKVPYFQTCEIGYKFSSAYHHRGYATEALHMALWVIFRDIRLHSVRAWVLPDNQPSINLLTRLGFSQEGLIRDYLFIQGRWQDNIQFSLLDREFQ